MQALGLSRKEYVCPMCGKIFWRDSTQVKVEQPCCTRKCAVAYRKVRPARAPEDEVVHPVGQCSECRRTCGPGDVRPCWKEGSPIMCVACLSDYGIPWEYGT